MEIDPARRRAQTDSDNGDANDGTDKSRDPDAQPHITFAHEQLLDGTARLYAQNALAGQSNLANPPPQFNDRILYVGMNSKPGDSSHVEQNRLEARNFPTFEVIKHSEDGADGADHVRVNGQVVDLSTDDGAKIFAASLGLPPAQTAKVAQVISQGAPGGRDELAGIATVWAQAEKGGAIPSRLVISGHCYGDGVWDGRYNTDGTHKDGTLSFHSVQALAEAMPKAAAQVEDIMLSACNTGDEKRSDGAGLSQWKEHFPNLKTAWGYNSPDDAHSPTEAHAVAHIAAWKAATAGRTTTFDGPSAVRAAYHALSLGPAFADHNVAIWDTHRFEKGH